MTYGLERTIYRITISRYVDNFILKGGILLYALFDKNFVRAIADVDLLANKISNEVDEMRKVFEEVFSTSVDDALYYNLKTLHIKPITEFKD